MSHPSINKLPAWIADSAWPKLNRKPMVFLADFDIPAGNDMSGRRKPHKVALFSCTGPGEHGPQIQFGIIEETGKSHQLAQGGHSVVYQTRKELAREERTRKRNRLKGPVTPEMIQDLEFGGDLIVAMEQITRATNPSTELEAELAAQYKSEGKLKPVGKWLRDRLQPSFRWVSRRPRWAEDEGHWAFVGSSPMCFLGQAHTTEENTHEGVPSGEMLYLFFQKLATGFEFKVVSQGCGEQTAEAQHKLEALISDFERQRGSTAAANVLVRKGDKWAHLFLLERAEVQPEILKLLAKKGATREIKEQAAEKLKAA